MKYFLFLLGFLFVPVALASVTLTSDINVGSLTVGTGATTITDGYEITCTSSTGCLVIHGFLNANEGTDGTSIIEARKGYVQTFGTGDILMNGGHLMLSGTGVLSPVVLALSGSIFNLTLSGSNAYTLGSTLDINGELVFSGSTLDNSAGYDLNVAGNWRDDYSSYTTGGETITFDGNGGMIEEESALSNIELDNGLVGYWKLDDGTGSTIARDDSGYGNDGTLTNGPTWSDETPESRFPNPHSLSFDGVNDYVLLSSHLNKIEGYNAGSISAWFKLSSSAPNTANEIFYLSDGDTANDFVVLRVANGDIAGDYADESLQFSVRRGGAPSKLSMFVRNGETYYADEMWHHICVKTGDGSNAIFVDGIQQSVTFANGSIATNEFSDINSVDFLGIGARKINGSVSGTFFGGCLDDVRIYNRVLSAAEVKALANGEVTTKGSALVGHWKFDEGTGTTAYDSSPFGNNGTLTGFTGTGWVSGVSTSFENPYALDFDGVDDYVVATSTGLPSGDITASYSVWYKTSSISSLQTIGVYGTMAEGQSFGLFLNVNGNGSISAEFNGGAGYRSAASVYSADQWNHFVVTKTPGAINANTKMFLNGSEIAASSASAVTPNVILNLNYIGKWTNSDYFFTGHLDDVRIYNRALKPWEIATLARGELLEDGAYTLGKALSLSGDVSIYSGTLRAGSGNLANAGSNAITLSGSWLNVGGFEKDQGTVTMDGTGTEHMTGSTVFWDYVNTDASTLYMDYRGRQSFSGSLTLDGMTLRSTKTGSAASILLDPSASQSVTNVDVADNDASGGQEIDCTTGCTDSSGNSNWSFGAVVETVIQGIRALFPKIMF